jgi:hypothetical protein
MTPSTREDWRRYFAAHAPKKPRLAFRRSQLNPATHQHESDVEQNGAVAARVRGPDGRGAENFAVTNPMSTETAPPPPPPRGTDWDKDGVGIGTDGKLIIREKIEENPATYRSYFYTPIGWIRMADQYHEAKWKMQDIERELNGRQPDRFLPLVLEQLDGFFLEASAAKDRARAEAYAASAAIIRGFLAESKERERRR